MVNRFRNPKLILALRKQKADLRKIAIKQARVSKMKLAAKRERDSLRREIAVLKDQTGRGLIRKVRKTLGSKEIKRGLSVAKRIGSRFARNLSNIDKELDRIL